MNRMLLYIEETQKLAELTENGQIRRKKSYRMQSSPILGHPPNSFWLAAGEFKVAQFGG